MGSIFRPRPEVGLDAFRSVCRLLGKLASRIGGNIGYPSNAADTTCDRLAGLRTSSPIVQGVVVRAGLGSYDSEVTIHDGQTVVCSMLVSSLSDVYGPSQVCMPPPGSPVLVYLPQAGILGNNIPRGVILGVVPEVTSAGVTADGSSAIQKLSDTEYPEGGASQLTEYGPKAVATDTKYPYKGEFQCGRPHDMTAGEYGILNHSGAGMVIGALSTTIKGSEAASVRCSALDDQVRVVSGHFRHISAAGSDETYNDGGFISVESTVSMYQSERLGMKDKDSPAFEWKPLSRDGITETQSGISPKAKNQTAKKRMHTYTGYLGDIVNVFVAAPDPDAGVESMDSDSQDQGLFHQHIDSSGGLTVRSAAGIMLERYDRIPVPKRKHYAWDPEGDNEGTEPEEKRGFSHPVEYPMGIGVTLADRAAWCDYLAYSRFRQFSKDFKLPVQKELKCPDSKYDSIGKAEAEFEAYDKRHSYIGLTPDGGIVLRDAWGSEIVMADGRITLNAAANIEIRSGSSVVVMGGDDVIAKAYNSLDLSATKKDVRIKAENNMQCMSSNGGVLIQSKARSDSGDWRESGESLRSAGVVLKADKSSVRVIGKTTAINGESSVSLSAFNSEGKPDGTVSITGQQVFTAAKSNVVASVGGTSGLVLTQQTAVVCAPSVLAAGGTSATSASGDSVMVGIPVKVGNLYVQTVKACKSISETFLDSTAWLSPMEPSTFSEVEFKFRTSEQYGTVSDSGISGGVFSVYQASWAAMAEAGVAPLGGLSLTAWDEEPDEDGEYPWPGKGAIEGGYVTYEQRNVGPDGLENPGSYYESGRAELTHTGFLSYHIRSN